MLSGGDIPEHSKLSSFEDHIARLRTETRVEPNGMEKSMCQGAFDSGSSTAISYLMKAAKLDNADLLSAIPSASQ